MSTSTNNSRRISEKEEVLDKVALEDISIQAIIGVYPNERQKKQNIILNIVIYTDITKAGESDNIKHTVDYSKVYDRVLEFTETSKLWTLEALVFRIARILCVDFEAEKVWVKAQKPNALLLCKQPSVEISRTRAWFQEYEKQRALNPSICEVKPASPQTSGDRKHLP